MHMRRIPALPPVDPGLVASAASALLAVLIVGAFAVAARSAPVHSAAWVVAGGVAVLALTGLLYAWRLGAYGRSR